jgi:3-dehydroquinate synthase
VTVSENELSVRVDLAERSYPIRIGRGSSGFASFLASLVKGRLALLAHDSRLGVQAQNLSEQLIHAGWRVGTYAIPSGEASKSAQQLQSLWTALANLPADRSTAVIALGGGVVGDLAGFAAATFNRGLPLVMIPTTLLSMVDSSVGGKTGINLPEGKNLVGAFHQPSGVWIDLDHLATLPPREASSGLAEVVKYGVILDPSLLDTLEHHADYLRSNLAACPATAGLVARSCELKAAVVRDDERETTGLRAVLNYGHTFAHGFETVLGYGAWLHGEAVSAGMVCAAELAHRIGYLREDFRQRQTALLDRLGLPVRVPKGPVEPLLAVMRRDKKNLGGAMRFVLPQKPGKVELVGTVPEAEAAGVLADLMT